MAALFTVVWGRKDARGPASIPRPSKWALCLASTLVVLIVAWAPPVFENLTTRPGNLTRLWEFFAAVRRPDHTFAESLEVVAKNISLAPLAIGRTFFSGLSLEPTPGLAFSLAAIEVAALVLSLCLGCRRGGHRTAAILASVALVQIAGAVWGVRSIRGEISPHLVYWITIIGFTACAALAAQAIPSFVAAVGQRTAVAVLVPIAIFCLGAGTKVEALKGTFFPARIETADTLATGVTKFLRASHIERPEIQVASHESWWLAAAVVLHLYKQAIPFSVERNWLFMMGQPFGSAIPDRPRLMLGTRALQEASRLRPDRRLVVAAGDTFVYLEDPTYLRTNRSTERLSVLSSYGTRGEVWRAVDGLIPPEGDNWDSPMAVILDTKASFLEITTPQAPAAGVFLSADGNDDYAVTCVRSNGETLPINSTSPGEKTAGMRTRVIVSTAIGICSTIKISPVNGDGAYSIGEVGFIEKTPADLK